jgi:pimeloyl-ACP methyl ester carboxylesterase
MTHFFADDGEKIHVQISGDGPSVVMLHGWTSSNQEWLPFLPDLTAHHRVYRWDARGHAQHPEPQATPPTVQRMARDLDNLLDHYRLDGPTVVGHSMGALTLWQYIRDFGCTRLGKVVFIDQSPKLMTDPDWSHGIYGNFDAEKAMSFFGDLKEDFPESVLRLAAFGLNERAREKYLANAKGWEKSRQFLAQLNSGALVACWQSLVEADYRDVLKTISIPALLVYGEQSNFYRTETAHYVASRIPGALLAIYEGTDHSPHQWQRARFVADLRKFIDG